MIKALWSECSGRTRVSPQIVQSKRELPQSYRGSSLFRKGVYGYDFNILQNDLDNFAKAALLDDLLEHSDARPPIQSSLYLTKCHKRLTDLNARICRPLTTAANRFRMAFEQCVPSWDR